MLHAGVRAGCLAACYWYMYAPICECIMKSPSVCVSLSVCSRVCVSGSGSVSLSGFVCVCGVCRVPWVLLPSGLRPPSSPLSSGGGPDLGAPFGPWPCALRVPGFLLWSRLPLVQPGAATLSDSRTHAVAKVVIQLLAGCLGRVRARE